MGSGRDKRKKAKPKAPGAGAEKTSRKTGKNEGKAVKRAAKAAKGGDDDVDALLAQFALEEKAKGAADVREDVAAPSARVYASFTAHPTSGDIYLFGGEFFDGAADKQYTFADLYRYQTSRNMWSRIISPKGPALRTSHQAVIVKQYLYIFGGELTSLNQSSFKHYRDLWRLDLESLKWEQLSSKGGPIARSGHRMVAFKSKLILFGGFHDDGTGDAKYFNDVWEYDTEEHKWECRSAAAATGPSGRGGCQLALHGTALFVIGGHTAWREGKEEKEKVHDDVWTLDLHTWQWEKVKKAGLAPSPRTSFALAPHKKRAIIFGGVTDQHGRGDHMFSTLHDELYQFNLESRRWYPLQVKAPAKARAAANAEAMAGQKSEHPQQSNATGDAQGACDGAAASSPQQTAKAGGASATASSYTGNGNTEAEPKAAADSNPQATSDGSVETVQPDLADKLSRAGADKGSALYKAAARIQSRFRGYTVRKTALVSVKAYKAYKLGGKVSELLYSPALYGIDLSAQNLPKPRARSSPMMAVVGNTLWLFGGTVEIALDDVSLDDLWALDLNKLDGWRCIKENTTGDVKESLDSDNSSSVSNSDNDSA